MNGNTYKILIDDRHYTSWKYYNMFEYKEQDIDVSPESHKLLNDDVITVDDEKNVSIIHSTIRNTEHIPGVIVLEKNKTYGRAKNGKLLYKCIPDDRRLPVFLIPYDMKNIGFSKVYINKYITFQYTEWTSKHPYGKVSQVIGTVDILDNYYEYQLYCKSLHASIQRFTKDTNKAIKSCSTHDEFIDNICKQYDNIEDRTDKNHWKVFSIDPIGSVDFDDAFSIKNMPDDTQLISIYISNVTIWLDVLNLWDSFSQRISTIYLPDKKRPMLPSILSDCLCSLMENRNRIALAMDIEIKDGTILNMKYSNVKINVFKNYRYDETALLMDVDYHTLLETSCELSKKYKYMNKIRDSHDLVAYLMILMNYHSGKTMLEHNNGILRSSIINKQIEMPTSLPDEVSNFIKIWNSTTGQYLDATKLEKGDLYSHDLLNVDAYIHITSPIRRIVDLLNIIKIQENLQLVQLSENSAKFYNKWIDQLEYINTTMRYIRRVQNDCSLLHNFVTNPDLLDRTYKGYVFDKIERSDGLFHYVIYFPELRMTSKITVRKEMNNYDCKEFHLFIFQDEDSLKRKIRVQII